MQATPLTTSAPPFSFGCLSNGPLRTLILAPPLTLRITEPRIVIINSIPRSRLRSISGGFRGPRIPHFRLEINSHTHSGPADPVPLTHPFQVEFREVSAVFALIDAIVAVAGCELVTDDSEHHRFYPEFFDDAVAKESFPCKRVSPAIKQNWCSVMEGGLYSDRG